MFSVTVLRKLSRGFHGVVNNLAVKYGTLPDSRMADKLYAAIELEIKSFEPAVIKSYQHFIETAAALLSITVANVACGRKPNIKRFTVLKSAHVHRKHLVQYEIRTYYTWIHLKRLTGSTADTFLEYIQRMLPEGVALKVTKTSVEPLQTHLTAESISKVMEHTRD